MKNINNNVFFSKISQKVNAGDFDTHFTIPFMTKELFLNSIKGRLDKKLTTGGTPILSDTEIQDCLEESKETAAYIISVYIRLGIMKRTESGFEFTKSGEKLIRVAYNS